jgi:hypothetical protein
MLYRTRCRQFPSLYANVDKYMMHLQVPVRVILTENTPPGARCNTAADPWRCPHPVCPTLGNRHPWAATGSRWRGSKLRTFGVHGGSIGAASHLASDAAPPPLVPLLHAGTHTLAASNRPAAAAPSQQDSTDSGWRLICHLVHARLQPSALKL